MFFHPVGEQIPRALTLYVAPIRPSLLPGVRGLPCWGLPGSGLRLPQEKGVQNTQKCLNLEALLGCKDPTL